MPITIVAGSNLASAVANGGNPSLTWPTLQPYDVAIVLHGHTSATAPALSTSGYTQADAITGSRQSTVWYKVMGASPDTSVAATGSGDSLVGEGLVGIVLRGVDPGTVLDVTPTHTNNNTTNPDAPSITTATDGAWVVAMAWSAANDAAVTDPSGYSNGVSATIAETNSATVALATKQVSPAGAEDPPSWTNWISGQWHAYSIAIRPSRPSGMVMRYTN